MIKFVRVRFHGVWRSWIWKFLELSTGYEWVCYLSVQGIILRVKISEKRRIQLLHLKKKRNRFGGVYRTICKSRFLRNEESSEKIVFYTFYLFLQVEQFSVGFYPLSINSKLTNSRHICQIFETRSSQKSNVVRTDFILRFPLVFSRRITSVSSISRLPRHPVQTVT